MTYLLVDFVYLLWAQFFLVHAAVVGLVAVAWETPRRTHLVVALRTATVVETVRLGTHWLETTPEYPC